jgi:hypothetical protein
VCVCARAVTRADMHRGTQAHMTRLLLHMRQGRGLCGCADPTHSLVEPGDLPPQHGAEGQGAKLAGQALAHHACVCVCVCWCVCTRVLVYVCGGDGLSEGRE